MRSLTGEVLLAAWDNAQTVPELSRPIALLAMAWPEEEPDRLADLPLAARNRLLLQLREATFGGQMNAFAACPACGTRLEFSLLVDPLLRTASTPAPLKWEEDGRRLTMRPASTRDLAAVLSDIDAEKALLQRCVEALGEDAPSPCHDEQRLSWRERFDTLNASAETECVLQCPECGEVPHVDFDIAAFFCKEVRVAARTLLLEVHAVASAYGWTQADILALTPLRRRAYLEMLSV